MKTSIDKKRATTWRPATYSRIDCHKWATKMEMHRLLSGKPDLKIKEAEKQTN